MIGQSFVFIYMTIGFLIGISILQTLPSEKWDDQWNRIGLIFCVAIWPVFLVLLLWFIIKFIHDYRRSR